MTKKRKLKKGVFCKLVLLVLILTLIILLAMFILRKFITPKETEYVKNINYFNKDISIKLYTKSIDEANIVFDEIEKIYKHYYELIDRKNSYENLNNVYKINSITDVSMLELDIDLFNIIKLGNEYFYKTNGIFNINDGKYVDMIESTTDFSNIKGVDIKDIVLYDDNKILTGNINLNLDIIGFGYADETVAYYLKEINLEKYVIDSGNSILVGNNKYSINIAGNELNLTNKKIFMTSKDDKIVDSKNKKIPDYFQNVVVITDDSIMGSILSKTLYIMSTEEGQEFIKNFSDVDVIWTLSDGTKLKSSNVKKYE